MYVYMYIYIYIYYLIIIQEIYKECLTGTMKITKMFLRLGFLIHPHKVTFLPS